MDFESFQRPAGSGLGLGSSIQGLGIGFEGDTSLRLKGEGLMLVGFGVQ